MAFCEIIDDSLRRSIEPPGDQKNAMILTIDLGQVQLEKFEECFGKALTQKRLRKRGFLSVKCN